MSRIFQTLWAVPLARRLLVGAAAVAALWLLSRTQAPLEARTGTSPGRLARIAGGNALEAPEGVSFAFFAVALAVPAVALGLLLAWWSDWAERRRPIRRRTRWSTSKARILVLVIASVVTATLVCKWLSSASGRYDPHENRLACARSRSREPGQSFHQSISSGYERSASA